MNVKSHEIIYEKQKDKRREQMNYNGILVLGYCRDIFQRQMNPMESIFDKKDRQYEEYEYKLECYLKERRMNFYMDVTFLMVYELLSKEEFYLWMEYVKNRRKEKWRNIYYLSEYNNRHFESFFDMRAGVEAEWLTGMLVRIKQGGRGEYWELMNGIAMMYPWERQYIQKRNVIKIEELLNLIKKENNEILKAGKLIILLVMSEFYHKQITRNDGWNKLETVLWKGLEFYQRNQWSVDQKNPVEFKKIVEKIFMKHGIHPSRIKKYSYLPKEIPVFEEKVAEENWIYLWQTLLTLMECVKMDKEDYKQLKLRADEESEKNKETQKNTWNCFR